MTKQQKTLCQYTGSVTFWLNYTCDPKTFINTDISLEI